MSASPYTDALVRLSEARRDFINTRRRGLANQDSLSAFLTPSARGRYRDARYAAMCAVDLPSDSAHLLPSAETCAHFNSLARKAA